MAHYVTLTAPGERIERNFRLAWRQTEWDHFSKVWRSSTYTEDHATEESASKRLADLERRDYVIEVHLYDFPTYTTQEAA